MKTFSWSLLILLSSIMTISLTGCGEDPKPKAMTEGISISEIEAYEKAQRDMQSESMTEMDNTGKK